MPALVRILTPAGLTAAPYTADSLADAARHEPHDGVYTITNTYRRDHVLKLDAHVGEYKAAGPNATALLRLGDISTLHVRTDIDELDSWRFDTSGEAVASIRGGSKLQVPLRFVRIVPDIAPKRTLTGENSERIDTRVMQVIYALENPPAFVQPGMLVDVAAATKPAK